MTLKGNEICKIRKFLRFYFRKQNQVYGSTAELLQSLQLILCKQGRRALRGVQRFVEEIIFGAGLFVCLMTQKYATVQCLDGFFPEVAFSMSQNVTQIFCEAQRY